MVGQEVFRRVNLVYDVMDLISTLIGVIDIFAEGQRFHFSNQLSCDTWILNTHLMRRIDHFGYECFRRIMRHHSIDHASGEHYLRETESRLTMPFPALRACVEEQRNP